MTLLGVVVSGAYCDAKPTDPAPNDAERFSRKTSKFFGAYCTDCHAGEAAEAGVDLGREFKLDEARRNPSPWNRVRGLIAIGAMPPTDYEPRPSDDERQAIIALIDELVNHVDCSIDQPPPHVAVQRLNAVEYDNTICDLLGIALRPSQSVGFPADDVGNGFTNQGEVLSVSPMLLEKYLEAAELVVEEALSADGEDASAHRGLLGAVPNEELSPREAASRVFAELLPRAFRRPVTESEVQAYVELALQRMEAGANYRDGIAFALQGVLVSPHFLFRVEDRGQASESGRLDDYAMASRLSYFLWSSMPDDALFAAAAKGELTAKEEAAPTVDRMLDDSRAAALIENFFSQWLGLGALVDIDLDSWHYPIWTGRLRDAMQTETLMVCQAAVKENLSLFDLIRADFTFVNPRLAELYGIDFDGRDPEEMYMKGPGFPDEKRRRGRDHRRREGLYQQEDQWRRVPAPPHRRGLLTHASILAITSNPKETSPVKRGKWVLDTVLGDPPPPAPPGVPTLEESAPAEGLTVRQQLEIHRADPACAGCHTQMDPIGLGLENFDSVGKWRRGVWGKPVDPAGELNGKPFNGHLELIDLIESRRDDIARHFASRLLTYALGRGLWPQDECAIDEIVAHAADRDYRMRAFIQGVVLSKPFRNFSTTSSN